VTIAVLPDEVVNRIAAGEVVDRPASVVKELVENAIDAGATRVVVDVEQSGRRLIRVTDDGGGMTRDEAALAFYPHATSKIRTDADLLTIQTMGFRGEALPSIAAVSNVRLITVAAGALAGTEIGLEGGALVKQRDAAAAPGTMIEVADLFAHTPARKKFLKSSATELGHICQAVQRQALAFPAIHFRLSHDGHVVSEYPAVRSLRERVQQVYGEALIDACVEIDAQDGALHLEGLVCRPVAVTGSRTPQELFVNRRWVKNASIAHALYDGYGTYLAKGRHPRFVLALTVDSRQVDVNVHPTKREVRFSDHALVHDWVRTRIQAVVRPASAPSRFVGASTEMSSPSASRYVVSSPPPTGARDPLDQPLSLIETAAELAQAYLPAVALDVRTMGQIANRYLLAQIGDEVQIVDQHTAHERVLFERLSAQFDAGTVASQQMLLPQVVDLSAGEMMVVCAHLDEWRRLGFEIEEFGQGTIMVRAMPALVARRDPQALLRAMVEAIVEEGAERDSTPFVQERYNAVLATMACHSAVRAGRTLEQAEIQTLLEDWRDAGFPSACPHGRRIAMRLRIEELDRMFGRLGWT